LLLQALRSQPSPLTPVLGVGVGRTHTPILRFEKLDRLCAAVSNYLDSVRTCKECVAALVKAKPKTSVLDDLE
jgi:hypothetical protein